MEHGSEASAGITVALALAAGMASQALARHLRLPGIVVLLVVGVALGPDMAGIVQPSTLGAALHVLVGFAVAVILFEGGLNLDVRRLRREATVIQRLLTLGAAITGVGAAIAARYLMDWSWQLAAAFGSLVIVTGPTVVTPLLRRIKVKHAVETVLEAEGVLIDAVGAVVAVVVLQIVIGASVTEGLVAIVTRLGFGLLAGVIGGAVIAALLHVEHVVPEGLENVFTLSLVLALFQGSNAVLPESGVMTVTAAGMIVGNARTRVQRDLLEFKEQLTVMLIGMLFVLLAADVRVAEVRALGLAGAATVVSLMIVVRPLNVAICTWGSTLSNRERLFVAWLAPRGVVAAAVATLFAQAFEAAGIPGGKPLQALVFLVIAGTVVVQGLTGGLVARLLDLRRPAHRGWAILGANEVGLAIGTLLRDAGDEVTFVDSNPRSSSAAEAAGFKVAFGNVIHERTMQRAQLDDRAACIAVTPNDEINLLFARSARDEFKVPLVLLVVDVDSTAVNSDIVARHGAELLFGVPRDVDVWSVRLRRGLAEIEAWRLEREQGSVDGPEAGPFAFPRYLILPLVARRGDKTWAVHGGRPPREGDVLHFAVFVEQRAEAHAWLADHGWVRAEALPAAAAGGVAATGTGEA